MKAKVGKTTNIVLRIAIMLLTIAYVYKQIHHRLEWDQWKQVIDDLSQNRVSVWFAIAIIALVPLNLFLESVKWKRLIDRLEKVTYNRAFTAVLTGLSVSMFLPNRVGDYLGKVFVLNHANRIESILVTIIGSIAQWIVFIAGGSLALIIVFPSTAVFQQPNALMYYIGLIIGLLLIVLLSLGVYFNLRVAQQLVTLLFPGLAPRLKRYIHVFSLYSGYDLLAILCISAMRYIVFTFQFFLMLRMLSFSIPYTQAILALALMYMALTLIPTIALTELGVRGSVSVGIFTMLFEHTDYWNEQSVMAVLLASVIIWLINVAVPALTGVFFVYRLKFIRNGNLWNRK